MRVGTRLPRRRRIRRRASANFLSRLDWNNSILLKGELAEEVAKLKVQDGGEIQVHGSGEFLQTLLKHDLVDTLRLGQFPVVLRTGKRLFGAGTIPCSFRLVDTQQAVTGAVLHVYERAGNLNYGEMEVGQETVIFDADAAQRQGNRGATNTSSWAARSMGIGPGSRSCPLARRSRSPWHQTANACFGLIADLLLLKQFDGTVPISAVRAGIIEGLLIGLNGHSIGTAIASAIESEADS